MIKVGVLGARGRMGRTVCETVSGAPDTELTAQVDQGDSLDALLGSDVVVDFTHVAAVMANLRWCVEHGLNVVVGTSGFGDDRLAEVRSWLDGTPGARVLIAPNFSVGAVLMMRFASQAARFFESAEIIELHHANKMDAPSGTALRTASMIGEARAKAGLGAPPDATKQEMSGALGTSIGLGGSPGSPVRRPRRDTDDPPRLPRPRVLHARRPPGSARGEVPPRGPHSRPRAIARPRLACSGHDRRRT
jgi:4-hydroxy-tetrahydrodipicolinate reductase